MGPFSLRSPTAVTRLPSSPMRKAAMERCTSFAARSFPFPSSKSSFSNHPDIASRPRSSGTLKVAAGSNTKTAEATEPETVSKDNDLVFVAGATGKVGSRTVRELLKLGFRVRAGVRSTQKAEALVQSAQQMKLDGDGCKPVERLEIVECDLENPRVIGPAIGSASTVICCIGASEKEVFDITGPYRIDFQATKNLIEAATLAKVNHFILLTSLGTNKIGFPAAILNLFWGVLIWKRKAEKALIASGLPYTIVRPGGMERPTDSYKETHNIILASQDTYFGGQVSNLQVAELMAFMAKTRNVSLYKVVEVIAETTAPLTPMEVLLSKIQPEREIPAEPKQVEVPPSIRSEPATTPVTEEEPDQIEQVKERPLSPYFMYDDLKPPVSPTPTPSTTPAIPKEKQVEVQAISAPETTSGASSSIPTKAITEEKIEVTFEKAYVLSPYAAYEDLKPPTSPTPTPPRVEKKHVNAIQIESGSGDGSLGTAPILPDVPPQSSGSRSPYHALIDPSATAPSAPTGSPSATARHLQSSLDAGSQFRSYTPRVRQHPHQLLRHRQQTTDPSATAVGANRIKAHAGETGIALCGELLTNQRPQQSNSTTGPRLYWKTPPPSSPPSSSPSLDQISRFAATPRPNLNRLHAPTSDELGLLHRTVKFDEFSSTSRTKLATAENLTSKF